jgi:signal transduction histidine kinase
MKIINKLMISLIFTALFPVVIASLIGFKITENHMIEMQLNNLRNINDEKAKNIYHYIEKMQDTISDIASYQVIYSYYNNLSLGLKDKANPNYRAAINAMDYLFQPIQQDNNYDDIFVINGDGVVLYSSNEAYSWRYFGGEIANVDHTQWQNSNEYFTPIFFDEFKGASPSFLLIKKVENPDAKSNADVLYVAVEANLDDIYKIVNMASGLGMSGESILLNQRDGKAFFISPTRFLKTAVLSKQFNGRALDAANEKFFVLKDYRGKNTMGVFDSIPTVHWTLITKMDESEIFNVINELKFIALLTAAVICLLAIFIAIYLANTIATPLIRLKEAVERIQYNNLDVDLTDSVYQSSVEVKILADAFVEMSQNLKESYTMLGETINKLNITKERAEKALVDLKTAQSALLQSEKMSSLGVLTAGVAHEINNPINFIAASLVPLKRDMDDVLCLLEKYLALKTAADFEQNLPDIEQYKKEVDLDTALKEMTDLLAVMHNGTERTKEIVKSLRLFSRADDSGMVQTDMNECIRTTLVLLLHEYKNKVEIITDYQNIPSIPCHVGEINQVLINIIINAIHAIVARKDGPPGEIHIRTEKINDQVVIKIKDNGSGIKKTHLDKIFEPFFTTKDVGQGTGLGLSISYGIIKRHGGNIEVNTVEGQGTEFVISLPIHEASPA